MRKKSESITTKLYPLAAIAVLLFVWESLSVFEIVPNFMLPSPVQTVQAFIDDFSNLMANSVTTLTEAVIGLAAGVTIGFLFACVMDRWEGAYKALYPLIVVTQTVPTVAIAPLLVLWFGYEMTPKIVLIIIVTFFPIAVGVLDGFHSADQDAIHLLQSMGASKTQIFHHIKVPGALPNFFSGLKISVTYSIVGAVLAEWLGGFRGLGVYMTRVRKSFAYDKMFAVIFLISIISLLLMWVVKIVQRKLMPWEDM